WTPSQERVISSGSGRLICSAAAGSGKTAVMIERIVRLIREGADPFSFLVITVTNAAAAEMKEKIRRRLMAERSDEKIAAAAEKAGAMEVCTIHAFCQHLIRQEFQIVGVDPFFQICTGAQRDLRKTALRRWRGSSTPLQRRTFSLFPHEEDSPRPQNPFRGFPPRSPRSNFPRYNK
ncbi:MAG: UvrD-helicase domain-containing protein, partial [Firmicutes bacterium]|nr:UvrD-helicase domain-containing protein [Bacillota bacterium]